MPKNVLLSSSGRRVELLECIRQDLRHLRTDIGVIAVDSSPLTAAGHLADTLELVPRVDDPSYLDRLLDVVQQHQVDLIIPTIDTELAILAENVGALRREGAHVLVSGLETIAISGDKWLTHSFLDDRGIPHPEQWTAEEALALGHELPYPVIAKPRRGSSSVGVSRVSDVARLRPALGDNDYLVQSIAPGDEYTVDAWVDSDGRAQSVVPRRRMEVRGGEASKAVTARRQSVIEQAVRTVEALPDAYGPITVQIFADESRAEVIEINARFGGGYPLSWESGARTTQWAIRDARGLTDVPGTFSWEEGTVMLRYDQSVFIRQAGGYA